MKKEIGNRTVYLDHIVRGTIGATNPVTGYVWFTPDDKDMLDGWYPAERISRKKAENKKGENEGGRK